jgi:protein Mpv17
MKFAALFRAGLQSGTIMGVADICTQLSGLEQQQQQTSQNKPSCSAWDPQRTARWASAGLLIHGPYFFYGFSRVDAYFGATVTSFTVVLKKTAVAQCILFPPYLVLLFTYLGLLERHESIPRKLQQRVPQAFIDGCVYWPIANIVNFGLVPSTLRVPYVAFSAGIWNAYLSWSNACGVETREAALQKLDTQ